LAKPETQRLERLSAPAEAREYAMVMEKSHDTKGVSWLPLFPSMKALWPLISLTTPVACGIAYDRLQASGTETLKSGACRE
jgi:hypothetical protein